MSFLKRLWHAVTAFLYLRLYEFLFGYLVLGIAFYFTKSISIPYDLQGAPRLTFAAEAPFGFIVIYYYFYRYVFVSLLAVLTLRITPFFRKATLAAVNSLTYAAHGLWVIHLMPHSLPLSIWATWLVIVIFNSLSPLLLPRRVFDEPASQ